MEGWTLRFIRIAQQNNLHDVAAKAAEAGYNVGPVYHGSATQNITNFDPSLLGAVRTSDWGTSGVYFTPSKNMANSYRISAVKELDEEAERLYQEEEEMAKSFGTRPMNKWLDLQSGRITEEQYKRLMEAEKRWRRVYNELENTKKGAVYPAYLKIDAPFVYRYVGITDPYLSELAMSRGHDAVIVTAEDEDTSGPIEEWAQEILVFSPNQIKSAAPTTYDDAGNPIPLEQRFDPSKNDIRY